VRVCVCLCVYCVTMMLLDLITCRKCRLLIPVVYRRSRTEVRPRSIWRGLKLLAVLQNAKHPWVIHSLLGVPIVETFVQECCNGYGHKKFYAGTVTTSDCLIPACELVQFAKVFCAKYALPALF
jgi:hypothetical protein